MEIEFSILLRQLMESENMKLKDLYEKLQGAGAQISYPTLSTYRKGNSVPSFRKAKQIVQLFDYPISDEELQDDLLFSKEVLHDQREENPDYIQRSVRIKPELFGMNADSLQLVLRQRITDLYGDEGNLNRYFNDLIKNDLVSSGFIRPTEADTGKEDS